MLPLPVTTKLPPVTQSEVPLTLFAVPAPFAVQTPVNVPLVYCDPAVTEVVVKLAILVVPLKLALAMFA